MPFSLLSGTTLNLYPCRKIDLSFPRNRRLVHRWPVQKLGNILLEVAVRSRFVFMIINYAFPRFLLELQYVEIAVFH